MSKENKYLLLAAIFILLALSVSNSQITGQQVTAAHCSNGVWDSDEADVDCGGFSCSACADGLSCWENYDCSGSFCYTDPNTMNSRIQAGLYPGGPRPQPISSNIQYQGVCQSIQTTQTYPTFGSMPSISFPTTTNTTPTTTQPTNTTPTSPSSFGIPTAPALPSYCSDGIWNFDESDVDCGGSCNLCSNTKRCWVGTDCSTLLCGFDQTTLLWRQAAQIFSPARLPPSIFATYFQGACGYTPQFPTSPTYPTFGSMPSITFPTPTQQMLSPITACQSNTQVKNATLGDLNNDGQVTIADANLLAARFYPSSGTYTPSCSNGIKDGSEKDVDCGDVCGNTCIVNPMTSSVQNVCATYPIIGQFCSLQTVTTTRPLLYCCQDLNQDGQVTIADLSAITDIVSGAKPTAGDCSKINPAYQTSTASYQVVCANNQKQGDLDNDGIIDLYDADLWNKISQGIVSAPAACCDDTNNDNIKESILDMNADHLVDSADGIAITDYALGRYTGAITTCKVTTPTQPTTTTTTTTGPTGTTTNTTTTSTQGTTSSTSSGTTGGGGGSSTRRLVCGNRIKESLEQCDDGNKEDEDGCSSLCKIEKCGDLIIQRKMGEQCDPPNGIDCSINCKLVPYPSGYQTQPTERLPITTPTYPPAYMPPLEPESRTPWTVIIITIALVVGLSTWWFGRQRIKKESYQLPVRYPHANKR